MKIKRIEKEIIDIAKCTKSGGKCCEVDKINKDG